MESEVIIDDLESDEELSYLDFEDEYVTLFHNGILVCPIEVFTDRENENREYICVNNEVTYLDTLVKR